MLIDGPDDEFRPRRRRRRRGGGGLPRMALIAIGLVAGVTVLVGAIPRLNPFRSDTVDRSQPVVLRSIEKLSEYRAATANLEVIVDVERDVNLLPDFIKGEKTLLVAAGRVDAFVDFARVRDDAIQVSEDRRSVTILVPTPQLAEPQLDLDRTRVFDRERGLLDRLESVFEDSPTGERDVLRLAEAKLAAAARADRGVLDAARRNTEAMLRGLLRGLGFERVTIRFGGPPEAEPR